MEGRRVKLRGHTGILRWLDRTRYPEAAGPDEHWLRVELNRSVDAYLRALGPSQLRAVEISGGAHASRGWAEYTRLDHPEFDLCAPLEGRGTFDVVICEQVLEHVVDPCAAARNLHGLCEPGGHVVVSTPFLVRVHELPEYGMGDYWRFTRRGLRALLEGAGLEVEEVGSWGNRDAVRGNLDRWSARRPWHSLRNEPDLPLQVWAFARNPGVI
jgi:SAM-dependent methyltransferase